MRRAALVVLLFAPNFAYADRDRAIALYEEGTVAYNLRNFQAAIQKYEAAYQEYPAPEFLFNIAQAYRQLDDCEPATHFYRRFLALKPNAKEKDEVAGRIADLDARCTDKKQVQDRPPEGTREPSPPLKRTETSTRTMRPAIAVETPAVLPPANNERWLDIRIQGGVAAFALGIFEVPVQVNVEAIFAHRIMFGENFAIEPGVRAAFAPIPVEAGRIFRVNTVEVQPLITFAVLPTRDLRLRLDAAAGTLVMFGLEEDGPIANSDGTALLFDLRAGAGLDYALGDRLYLSLSPFSIAWSPKTAKLEDSAGPIRRIDVTAGFGLRL